MTLLEDRPADQVVVLELKINPPDSHPDRGVRKVRTPEGAQFYKLPIGSPIKAKPDLPNAPGVPSAPAAKPGKKSKGIKEGTVTSKTGQPIKVGDTVQTGKGKKAQVTLVHPESGHASLHVEGSKYKYVAFHGSTLTHDGDTAPAAPAAPSSQPAGKYTLDASGHHFDYEIHPDGSGTIAIDGGTPQKVTSTVVNADLQKYGDKFQPVQPAAAKGGSSFEPGHYTSPSGAHLEVHDDGSGTVTTPKGSKAALNASEVGNLPKASWTKGEAPKPAPEKAAPAVEVKPGGKLKLKPGRKTPAFGQPAPKKAEPGKYTAGDGNVITVNTDGSATSKVKIEETGKTHTATWSAEEASKHVGSGAWKSEPAVTEPAVTKPAATAGPKVYENPRTGDKMTVYEDGTGVMSGDGGTSKLNKADVTFYLAHGFKPPTKAKPGSRTGMPSVSAKTTSGSTRTAMSSGSTVAAACSTGHRALRRAARSGTPSVNSTASRTRRSTQTARKSSTGSKPTRPTRRSSPVSRRSSRSARSRSTRWSPKPSATNQRLTSSRKHSRLAVRTSRNVPG